MKRGCGIMLVMKKNYMHMYCGLLLQLCATVLLGGCGLARNQIDMTHSFGSATAALGALGEEEFVGIRAGIIQMNAALLTLDNAKTTSGLVLDAPTSLAATAKRVAAAKALKNYGELLLALATAEPAANLQKSAQALAESMDSALGGDWSPGQRDAVQEIVTATGSFLLEKKKADSVKRIVPAYEKPVDALALLLAVDFSLDNDGFLQAYDITARRLKNAAIRVINSGNKYSLAERDPAVRAYRLAETALNRAAELDSRFSIAIGVLRKANHELVAAVGNREYSRDEIKKYAKQIRELADAYQVLAE